MCEGDLVHIIDDDASIRDVVGELLSTVSVDSRKYASLRQFFSADRPDVPGCIVLDVRLPGGTSGLEYLKRFADLGIKLPVVMTTGYGDVEMSVRAMKAGAADFLPKPFRAQEMIDAVAAALERDRQRRAIEADRARSRERFALLSSREKQILTLVASGFMTKQVAWKLGISEASAKVCRSVVMRKMELRSVADLVRLVDQLGSYMAGEVAIATSAAQSDCTGRSSNTRQATSQTHVRILAQECEPVRP